MTASTTVTLRTGTPPGSPKVTAQIDTDLRHLGDPLHLLQMVLEVRDHTTRVVLHGTYLELDKLLHELIQANDEAAGTQAGFSEHLAPEARPSDRALRPGYWLAIDACETGPVSTHPVEYPDLASDLGGS